MRSDTAPPSADTFSEEIEVPIAYSWTIEREMSATRARSSDAPVVIAPKTICSAARPPSSTAMWSSSSSRVFR